MCQHHDYGNRHQKQYDPDKQGTELAISFFKTVRWLRCHWRRGQAAAQSPQVPNVADATGLLPVSIRFSIPPD
jgi:hypothetical protein